MDSAAEILTAAALADTRAEQDAHLSRLDLLTDAMDKPTIAQWRANSPTALISLEARQIAKELGWETERAHTMLAAAVAAILGTGRPYEVFWWPYPSLVVADLRKFSMKLVESVRESDE